MYHNIDLIKFLFFIYFFHFIILTKNIVLTIPINLAIIVFINFLFFIILQYQNSFHFFILIILIPLENYLLIYLFLCLKCDSLKLVVYQIYPCINYVSLKIDLLFSYLLFSHMFRYLTLFIIIIFLSLLFSYSYEPIVHRS